MSVASLRRRMAHARETAWARIEQLRGRSRVFDLGFAVVSRDRLIASSILSAFVAFRLFLFLIPYVYVAVAGLGFYSESRPGGTEDLARDVGFAGVVAADIAEALQTSDRGRWVALIAGTLALSWASLGVSKSLYSVSQVAWRLPPCGSGTAAPPWPSPSSRSWCTRRCGLQRRSPCLALREAPGERYSPGRCWRPSGSRSCTSSSCITSQTASAGHRPCTALSAWRSSCWPGWSSSASSP